MAWPGWYPYPGIWYGGPYLSFGIGFGIGFFGGFGWGWGHWGFDWQADYPIYDGGSYYSRSNTFYNRNNFYRGGGERGGASDVRGGARARALRNRFLTETSAGAAEFTTVPAQRPGLSTETPRLLEDTLHPAARAASARAPSAATAMADRPGAIRHAEAPASVAERRVAAVDLAAAEDLAAAVAGVGNRSFVMFLVDREI